MTVRRIDDDVGPEAADLEAALRIELAETVERGVVSA